MRGFIASVRPARRPAPPADPAGLRSGVAPAANSQWFQRLRNGEDMVVMRAPDDAGYRAALIVATRAERPMGRFDGAMVAVIPLSALQPDLDDPRPALRVPGGPDRRRRTHSDGQRGRGLPPVGRG